MNKLISSLIVAGALFILGFGVPAEAALKNAWVSGHGTDAAGCGASTSPCRTFQYVHQNIVAAGGEIDVLDPADYGPVKITKALSIVNDGAGTARVQQPAANQNAITINAGTSDSVILRGLSIDGVGTGGYGITLNSGGSLTIVNCVVRHFTFDGINIAPFSNNTSTTKVTISNTTASDNATDGITFQNSGDAILKGVINQTAAVNNVFDGIHILSNTSAGSNVVITNTNASNNGYAGILLQSNGGPVTAAISQTTAANNYQGIYVTNNGTSANIVDSVAFDNVNTGFAVALTGASIILSHTVATRNGTGVWIGGGGVASSYGDNRINGNGTQLHGTLSPVVTQ